MSEHTCELTVRKRAGRYYTGRYGACGKPAYGRALFTASSGLQWLCPVHGGPNKRKPKVVRD